MPERDAWREAQLDYGQGKTRRQEADDSMVMLGIVMIAAIMFFAAAGLALYVWVF